MTERLELPRIIRKICLWCQGQSWKMVCECACTECALHAMRIVESAEPQLLFRSLKDFCLACAGSPEEVASCTANQAVGGQGPCPMHSIRELDESVLVSRQQVRTLPGLVEPLAAVGTNESARTETRTLSVPQIIPATVGTPMHPLGGFCQEHAPEALDI